MRNLTQQELEEVEQFKKDKNCSNVYVNTTYAKIKMYPIYNNAQFEFIKTLYSEECNYSIFDKCITNTLESKSDSIEELFQIYENELDFL